MSTSLVKCSYIAVALVSKSGGAGSDVGEQIPPDVVEHLLGAFTMIGYSPMQRAPCAVDGGVTATPSTRVLSCRPPGC
ncbi:MAG: hypothetical protein ACLRWL_05555 [Evtepia gabavorous]